MIERVVFTACTFYVLVGFASIKYSDSSAFSNMKSASRSALSRKSPKTRRQKLKAASRLISGEDDSAAAARSDIIITPINSVPEMLARMSRYFCSMVDPRSNRFYYRCLPETGQKIHTYCPIRDLGSAWDTTTLLHFLRGSHASNKRTLGMSMNEERELDMCLSSAIVSTISAYSIGPYLTFTDARRGSRPCCALSPDLLKENSNIAHSAFLLLATTGALRLELLDTSKFSIPIVNLVHGILSMQQDTGAFAIRFGDTDEIFQGIEFYPGEAILSLLDICEKQDVIPASLRREMLLAAQHAFTFYSGFYLSGGVDERYTSFFGNWQVQAFAKLHDILCQVDKGVSDVHSDPPMEKTKTGPWLPDAADASAANVADYVFQLCDAIVSSRPWKLLEMGRYSHLSTVEIACGLEALAEGTQVAMSLEPSKSKKDRIQMYWHNVQNAVRFLAQVQDQVPPDAAGFGGLGFGLNEFEQRLDVTGHAVNALIKVSRVQYP